MKRNLGVDIRFRNADGIESFGREVGDTFTICRYPHEDEIRGHCWSGFIWAS